LEGLEKRNINSYDDLLLEKQRLRREISEQEYSFKANPVYKIASSIIHTNRNNPFTHPLSFAKDINARANLKLGVEGILSALLLASRSTRKYFIMYTVAKEMLPYTIAKINELIKK
jgi:hypothetical protein